MPDSQEMNSDEKNPAASENIRYHLRDTFQDLVHRARIAVTDSYFPRLEGIGAQEDYRPDFGDEDVQVEDGINMYLAGVLTDNILNRPNPGWMHTLSDVLAKRPLGVRSHLQGIRKATDTGLFYEGLFRRHPDLKSVDWLQIGYRTAAQIADRLNDMDTSFKGDVDRRVYLVLSTDTERYLAILRHIRELRLASEIMTEDGYVVLRNEAAECLTEPVCEKDAKNRYLDLWLMHSQEKDPARERVLGFWMHDAYEVWQRFKR